MVNYVLIVDDDPDAQEALADIMQIIGLPSRTASDGHEALNTILAEPPALVMLDLMMPHLDGFGVLARMCGDPATRRIPVIVVTACSRDQIDMLKLPGVSTVVQKGMFTIDDITRLVRNILEPHTVRALVPGHLYH